MHLLVSLAVDVADNIMEGRIEFEDCVHWYVPRYLSTYTLSWLRKHVPNWSDRYYGESQRAVPVDTTTTAIPSTVYCVD